MSNEPASNQASGPALPATGFRDLDGYLALPRVGGLAMSADGRRLVVGVSGLNHDSTSYVTSLWEVDPAGQAPARRLTRGAKGESQAAFTARGDLLFIAERATAQTPEDKATPALWVLPADGGEARLLAQRPGGIAGVLTARESDRIVVSAAALPSATDAESEQRLRDLRKDTKVAAILHAGYPVRYWDHNLGPDAPRLFAAEVTSAVVASAPDEEPDAEAAPTPAGATSTADLDTPLSLRDLTPDAGAALVETGQDLSADGSVLVTSWRVPMAKGAVRTVLATVDVATGERRVIADAEDAEFDGGRISPDGSKVAYLAESISSPRDAPRVTLWLADVDGGNARRLAADWDRWPGSITWLPDSSALLVLADDDGRSPVFGVTLDGEVSRLTTDAASYTNVVVAPDGDAAYALRSSYEFPSEVVRIDLSSDADGNRVTRLRGPVERPALPGRLHEVETTAADGVRVRSWLALPEGASAQSPAPMLLWIHGGPLSSWNAWSWRWCPWLLVAQGYAVLLPDPALSTGYGQEFIQRGWGAWGAAPFTDLMAATDAAVALPEIDETRTAAMGGSFGGYMANWVAGHTDRFKAIVTHASLWALEGFGPTTDAAYYWGREMTPEMSRENSPHLSVENIVTPMLVIHGDKDYRVPIGEGLRLWYELLSKSGLPADSSGRTPHRFLFFPDENHWILSPQHAKVWYQVVQGFLGEHVLDAGAPELPESLG